MSFWCLQPSLVQRYQIFQTIENSKRLKDDTSDRTLDLQAYVVRLIVQNAWSYPCVLFGSLKLDDAHVRANVIA